MAIVNIKTRKLCLLTQFSRKVLWETSRNKYQKLFWPFIVWINCSSDLKKFSRSLEQFFPTVSQNNFGNKIPIIELFSVCGTLYDNEVKQRLVDVLGEELYKPIPIPGIALPEIPDVSLRQDLPFEEEKQISCGSVLINDRFILTAAHCEEQFTWVTVMAIQVVEFSKGDKKLDCFFLSKKQHTQI